MNFRLILVAGCSLIFLGTVRAAAPDDCAGAPVVVRTNSTAGDAHTFYGLPGLFGAPLPATPNVTLRLAVADPPNACTKVSDAALGNTRHGGLGTALLAVRGNCSFADKARKAQAAGAALLIVYDSQPGCFLMSGGNATEGRVDIPAVSASQAAGEALRRLAGERGATVTAYFPVYSPLDWSQALLLLMAVGTLVGGSLWAAADEREAQAAGAKDSREHKPLLGAAVDNHAAAVGEAAAGIATAWQDGISPRLRRSGSEDRAESPPPVAAGRQSEAEAAKRTCGGSSNDVMYVTASGAVGYLFIASAVLVVLYCLLNYISLIVVMLFCLGAQSAMIAVANVMLRHVAPRAAQHSFTAPCFGGRRVAVPTSVLVFAPFTMAGAAAWATHRGAAWAWAFQDVMGVCLVLSCLRGIRVTSLKVATVLLGSMLCYDVFWVFLQPRLTHSSSVMVEVATGGTSQQYPLPIVLLVPALAHFRAKGYAVLGLGDIALPGVLAAMCRCFDASPAAAKRSGWGSHFLPAVVAYLGGLLLTYTALALSWFGDQGQPALLWIVPCMLAAVTLSGCCHGDLRLLWHGWEGVDGGWEAGGEDSRRLLDATGDADGSSRV